MVKVRESPSVSPAVGVKLYVDPTMIEVGGVPDMVGGELVDADTVMSNGVRDAVETPSLTLIAMLSNEPVFAELGVPARVPLAELKLAQAGFPEIVKLSVMPPEPEVDGVKE